MDLTEAMKRTPAPPPLYHLVPPLPARLRGVFWRPGAVKLGVQGHGVHCPGTPRWTGRDKIVAKEGTRGILLRKSRDRLSYVQDTVTLVMGVISEKTGQCDTDDRSVISGKLNWV